MAWNLRPPARADLPISGDYTTDGSGNYESAWFETDALTLRVAIKVLGGATATGFFVDQGINDQVHNDDDGGGPLVISTNTLSLVGGATAVEDIPIVGRFIRFRLTGDSSPTDYIRVAIRKVA